MIEKQNGRPCRSHLDYNSISNSWGNLLVSKKLLIVKRSGDSESKDSSLMCSDESTYISRLSHQLRVGGAWFSPFFSSFFFFAVYVIFIYARNFSFINSVFYRWRGLSVCTCKNRWKKFQTFVQQISNQRDKNFCSLTAVRCSESYISFTAG